MNEMEARKHFETLADSLGLPSELNRDFLFSAFEACLEGAKGFQVNGKEIQDLGINPAQLALYLFNEHSFYLLTHPDQKQEELVNDEDYMSLLCSISLDKYFTNERLAYRMGGLASRYSPLMSTLDLYLNFILGMLSRYKRNDPEKTLIVDILNKGFQVAKCVSMLLEGGFETEAFSTWRTLHENECILHVLVKYGKPVMDKYLRHIQYGIAFRGGLPTKEATDAMFVEIKDNMKAIDLKSKDMKRYIEYGWLLGVPDVMKIENFKFNFRDGVEKVAGLSQYSKVYEMSSEVTHSSPVLIYSKKNYFFYMSLLNLYESFFRIEKIFASLYVSTVSDAERASYIQMRKLYYGEVLAAHSVAKQSFYELTNNKKKSD